MTWQDLVNEEPSLETLLKRVQETVVEPYRDVHKAYQQLFEPDLQQLVGERRTGHPILGTPQAYKLADAVVWEAFWEVFQTRGGGIALDDLDTLFDRLRTQIEHEDGLVNQRLGWLLSSEGFLFAAFAAVLITDKLTSAQKTLPLLLISALGFMISSFTFQSVGTAFKSLGQLTRQWLQQERLWRNRVRFPPIIYLGRLHFYDSRWSAFGIPIIIMLAWICFALSALWGWTIHVSSPGL